VGQINLPAGESQGFIFRINSAKRFTNTAFGAMSHLNDPLIDGLT